MSGIITSANYPILTKKTLNSVYMLEGSMMNPVYPEYFETRPSDFKYEEVQEIIGSGIAKVKAEGQATSFGTLAQGVTSRFDNMVYGLGLEVSMEEEKDNKYQSAVNKTRALKRSIVQTKDILCANILNRSATAGYTGGDGVTLLSASHPTAAGNQSNLISGSLSETTLEDAITRIKNARDASGLKMNLQVKQLIVPNNLEFDAQRICQSDLQSNTAENNMNVIKSKNYIPRILVNTYLDDTGQWYLQTNVGDGLIHFENIPETFEEDKATSILAKQYFAYFRSSFGWANWRCIYGSTGA